MKFIPWNEDMWLSKEGSILKYDKLEHFLAAFLTVFAGILLLHINPMAMVLIAVIVGVGWEIKDGFFSHGFSWKDLIADFAGIGIGYLIV